MILTFLLLLIALYFLLSYLFVNFKLSKIKPTPDKIDSTILPIQTIKKEKIEPPKVEPEKPVHWEKFATFDGVTFKYRSGSGEIFPGYFCSKHHVQMLTKDKRALGMRYSIVYCKCPMCKEHLEMDVVTLDAIKTSFQVILESYVKGHLKELPTRSDT
jgi:hypothetical protein